MHQNKSYGEFADIYDILTDDVEYEKRAEYIDKLVKVHLGRKADLLCDLGCGTGSICTLLSGKGYDCIGIDQSQEMLCVALTKNPDGKILYLNQNITDFELYGTVDVFLSMLDTVNYITDDEALCRMFSLVSNYLNPDGIFIFDVNTEYKFNYVLGNNTFVYEKDDIFYTWENFYEDGFLQFDINFFLKDKGDKYKRITEEHNQRYYSVEFLKNAGLKYGLETLAVLGDMSFENPAQNEERVFIVMKKIH